MANIKEIKTRIESIKNTKQITNAMKMVAAANLRKAQDRIVKARPYADVIDEMLRSIKLKNASNLHPLLEDSEKNDKTAVIIVTSDRGMCGSFNYQIIKKSMEYIQKNPKTDIICLGKKGYDYIKKRSDKIIKPYLNLFNEMNFDISTDVANQITNLFLEQNYDRIDVIYNEFKSAIQQDIIVKQLLPIMPTEDEDISKLDYIYEPDEDTIIDELGRKYIHVEIWRIMLESSAAEQGARMTAMDSATENASELIESLTLKYNRARQAAITTEIIEIASGAEAIQK
ncbi:MAG: ATP synthase F1 subunit gamma [Candidatus Cloacimonetes bacterium]|nr:ATP synthase F1 subunit gamma [Candidatus Cloacimonadota bacterium]MCF7813847.1 ATP synthase F1 subunit gamma [Candidatus Cloacimonadota bacterium]MCF7868285.1 ATP synthase F1 subunit gamma [Candidatus Cloacimonadota bacterium]MCF7883741.1 ATP synthase F1 subunit gamma [Candidatus Cloacimonadota bacterium]